MRNVVEIVCVFALLLLMGAGYILVSSLKQSPAARAAACATTQECTYFELLESAFSQAQSVQAFRFQEPCTACGKPSFTFGSLGAQASVTLSSTAAADMQALLRTTSSYILGGAQKAMPFVADYGLLVGEKTLLLFATSSKSVRLVSPETANTVLITNIDPIAGSVFDLMSQALP